LNFFSLFKRKIIYLLKNKIDVDKDKFSKNTNLDYLFKKYETDKSNEIHGFTKYYIKHLNKLKNRRINFLEIGSARGGSAAAFVHYFDKSNIFCLDVNLTLVKYKSDKINFFGLDSSNSKMLSKFIKNIEKKFSIKKFDVIIDDGSHILSDQLFSINYFYEILKTGGYYIVEDYKFPNYFKRCNDVDENTIDILIKKIRNNKIIKSKILQNNTINELKKAKIFTYKGRTKISDIVFFHKK
jgi:predicted O-methyltransferase YrrM